MDDQTFDLILQGCRTARSLEENLPNIGNQPQNLVSSCDEIIRVFSKAKENISKAILRSAVVLEPEHLGKNVVAADSGGSVEEWLRYSSSIQQAPAMGLLLAQQLILPAADDTKLKGVVGGGGLEEMVAGQMAGGREVHEPRHHHVMEAASTSHRPGHRASSSQRQPRRGGGGGSGERRVHRVAAPQMGNTEIPPEDGYTWRKYGQKDILNSRFPRSYFRCTHQKLYHCPAKKQVQRLDDLPHIFEVTYRGDHTCHLSSTAPSHIIVPPPPSVSVVEPPPPPPAVHTIQQAAATAAADAILHPASLPTSTSTSLMSMSSQWLSMDITNNMHREHFGGSAGGSTHVIMASTSTTAGPSSITAVEFPVMDMADVMFNSGGSSSTNSMDLIFSSMHHDHKWPPAADSADKTND